eukprot:CAMPEP_0113850168 /NCGR_PEP_ID=MMETSP0372-20130328/3667_1 /TAXON_ID=340204 /ORGANISM="Lankesteria abbotti" /LENGTH=123 /DNA_ID=CAMNT_0000820301 /DNA_START=129 /DNA_END=500 /DNA_ORIENTATION=+ /assembly_acc=CAM_ASM_000359
MVLIARRNQMQQKVHAAPRPSLTLRNLGWYSDPASPELTQNIVLHTGRNQPMYQFVDDPPENIQTLVTLSEDDDEADFFEQTDGPVKQIPASFILKKIGELEQATGIKSITVMPTKRLDEIGV